MTVPPRGLHCESTTASTRGGALVAGVAVGDEYVSSLCPPKLVLQPEPTLTP